MALPLEGMKVVDLSQVAAVPMAGRMLADLGADVLHVENPTTGDSFRDLLEGLTTGLKGDFNYVWELYNRNKKSVTIDLKQLEGQKILHRILGASDAFITNLRPFERDKFNLTYGFLKELNPRLVCGYLNGYGREGEEKNLPGYDHSGYWARSGIPHRLKTLTKCLQEPGTLLPAFMPSFGDHMAAMILYSGVMTALYSREKTGLGDEVHASLYQAGIYQQSFDMAGTLAAGEEHEDVDVESDDRSPLIGQYLTKDDRWVLLSILNSERYAYKLYDAIGRRELKEDPRFIPMDTLVDNLGEMREILKAEFKRKTLQEWRTILGEASIPYAPIQTHLEVVNDPQARANDFFVAYDHPDHGRIESVATPINVGKGKAEVRMPAPEFSEHTDEVLLELGYSIEELIEFKGQGIIF
jgi:crotonobetainyl-CoA:carnitine CoA-transferase CaiB-like acyl-CoA transferase